MKKTKDTKQTPNISGWNYRVVRRIYDGIEIFAVHEALYSNNKVVSLTCEPCWIQGSSYEELEEDLEFYNMAFGKRIIDYDTLEEL